MKKQLDDQAGGVNLGELISRLGAANNRWREGGAAEKVLALWDMGEELLRSSPDPRDSLLWEIQDRSYMTRNVLRYALIVRRGWPKRRDLQQLIPGLQSYTVFREALPFLKGDREGIEEGVYTRVVELLREEDAQAAADEIKRLKKEVIGRKHRKGVAAKEVRDDATTFARALSHLRDQAMSGSTNVGLSPITLLTLSQAAMAAALGTPDDRLAPSLRSAAEEAPDLGGPLLAALQKGRGGLSAFRKAIGPDRLLAAADLFNSLKTPMDLDAWRSRRGKSLLMQ